MPERKQNKEVMQQQRDAYEDAPQSETAAPLVSLPPDSQPQAEKKPPRKDTGKAGHSACCGPLPRCCGNRERNFRLRCQVTSADELMEASPCAGLRWGLNAEGFPAYIVSCDVVVRLAGGWNEASGPGLKSVLPCTCVEGLRSMKKQGDRSEQPHARWHWRQPGGDANAQNQKSPSSAIVRKAWHLPIVLFIPWGSALVVWTRCLCLFCGHVVQAVKWVHAA